MKALAGLFALTLSIAHTAELEVRIAVVEHSSAEVRNDPELAGKLQALVESATVHSTAWALPQKRWETALHAPRRVHATFDPPRLMKVKNVMHDAYEDTYVSEVLFAMPTRAPDHILLSTSGGIVAVTKYPACTFVDVALALGLKEHATEYVSLSRNQCAPQPTS